jgi:uncharacterized protein (TIGR03089 family)
MTTFPDVLAGLLRSDPGRPLVTFYDDATGERTELSVTTWATWVAKVSSLLADDLDVEHGSRLLVRLPAHWLGTVVLGAAWNCGLEVVWDGDHDAVVTGPEGLDDWAAEAERVPVLASALLPLAGPFSGPVPTGVHDLGVDVWSQPDAYVAFPAPADVDLAVAGTTQGDLWDAARSDDRVVDGVRLLSTANPASPDGLACLTGPLARGGSLVLLRHVSAERHERLAGDEHVTARFKAS